MPLIAKILPMPVPHTVAATVVPGSHPFELAVACEVFGLDRPELGEPLYRFVVCGVGPRVDLGPFTLETEHGIDALAAPTPSSFPRRIRISYRRRSSSRRCATRTRAARAWSRSAAAPSRSRPPVCSTAGASPRTGCTRSDSRAEYPSIHVQPDVLYVDDGQVLTSAGTSAGIDLSLYIVRHDHGAEVANYIARRMVVPPHRDGGQAQFLIQPMPDSSEADTLGPTLDWIVDNLDRPLTIEEMAAHALMSTRTFMRRFRAATGTTPLRWLSQQRVEHARRVLESTDVPVDRVAQVSGFGSAANFRVHFQRTVGTAPTSYRRAFRV